MFSCRIAISPHLERAALSCQSEKRTAKYACVCFVLSSFVFSSSFLQVGEKVTVVSFLANSEAECREWMQILEQFVIQRIPRKHVAFPFFAMRVPCVDGSLIPLDGLGMSAGAEFALLKLPQSVSLFDGESPISCGSSVKQLACYCNWRKPFVDSLCFRAATETVMSENEVRLDVRQPMATATFWQTCKKECKNGVWIDVFEDQQATSPEVLLAKWDLKGLKEKQQKKKKGFLTRVVKKCCWM